MKKTCDYCHQSIPDSVHHYTLRLELFPAVEPSLEIHESDLKIDFETEINRLIELMDQMDEAEVVKQEKLMFLAHSFTLCPRCRHKIAAQIENLFPPQN